MAYRYNALHLVKKIGIFTFIIGMTGITIYYANTLIKRSQSLEAAASAGNAQIFFNPASTTDKPLAFARIELTFDPNLVRLASELTLGTQALQRVITKTSMAEANVSGKIILVLGLDPTTLSAAPTGSFKLASFTLTTQVATPNLATTLTPVLANVQLVDTSAIPFTTTATSVTLTLNPVNPSPTPAASPLSSDNILPTVTFTSPTNGATFSRGSRVGLAASASDNVGVSQVQFIANGTTVCTDTTVPYSCQWKLPNSRGRSYNITATATDAAGNISSQTITIKSN
jgi:Bacterial Ig domain